MKMNKLGCDIISSCPNRHEESVSVRISFATKKDDSLFTLTRMSKNCSCVKVKIFDKKMFESLDEFSSGQ